MKMPGNMQNMMKQAQQMQERLQAEIAQIRVDGTAGGGMVTIKMDGHKNVLGVKIDPDVAGDVEMLQDLVLAASNATRRKMDEESQKKMGGMLRGPRPATRTYQPHARFRGTAGTADRRIQASPWYRAKVSATHRVPYHAVEPRRRESARTSPFWTSRTS